MADQLAEAFARNGHEVVLLTTADATGPPDGGRRYELVNEPPQVDPWREGPKWSGAVLPALIDRVDALWRQRTFDRAIALHPFYFGPALQAVAARHNKPFSVLFHGFELRSQLTLPARIRAARMRWGGNGPSLSDETLKLARRADEILANSAYTARMAAALTPKGPVRVIGCGLDKQTALREIERGGGYDEDCRRETRARYNVPLDAPLIGTVARLVRSKGVDDLIRLVGALPQAHGLIIGDGPERDNLQALAKRLSLSDRIHFVGGVDDAEKWRRLRAMDLFCLLSRKLRHGQVEGFGIALLEAGAAGCPVLATRSGGIVDAVDDGRTGLLTRPGDLAALRRAAAKLLSDPNLARRLVDEARRDILAKFNWDHISQTITEAWGRLDDEATDCGSPKMNALAQRGFDKTKTDLL